MAFRQDAHGFLKIKVSDNHCQTEPAQTNERGRGKRERGAPVKVWLGCGRTRLWLRVWTHSFSMASMQAVITRLWASRGSSNGWPNLGTHREPPLVGARRLMTATLRCVSELYSVAKSFYK